MNKKIVMEVPEEVLISMKETEKEFSEHIKMLSAVKLYQMGKMSSGRAAQFVGIPRVQFLHTLSNYGVPIIDLSKEELLKDLKNA